jgi:hypothetical protein
MQTNSASATKTAIDMAVIGANNQVPNWDAKAYKHALSYAQKTFVFATEDMRKAAPKELKVRDARAWGSITRRLLEEKKIKAMDRMRRSNTDGNHGRPVLVFQSKIFSLKK